MKTITAYFLGMLLNKVSRNKDKVKLFKKDVSEYTIFNFLDLAFYGYSFFPNYNNTQKLLAIISYVRDEFDIFEYQNKLQNLLNRYAFVFDKANLNDIVNLFLFCRQAKISIPYKQEVNIVERLHEKDDPILWASYLLYSQYSKKYFAEIQSIISNKLIEHMEGIVHQDSIYTYREFWWVIVFNKSPHINEAEQNRINNLISELKIGTDSNPGERIGKLFVEYLKNNPVQFMEWNMEKGDFLRNMTFKTKERSIFKNYKENLASLYWSSL